MTPEQQECFDLLMAFFSSGQSFNTKERKIEGMRWFNILFGKNETQWGCQNTWFSIESMLGKYYNNKK